VRSPATAAEDYYPLAVGNHWTYSVNFLGDRRERRVEIIGHRDGYYLDNEGGQLTVDGLGVRDQKRYLLRSPSARARPGRTSCPPPRSSTTKSPRSARLAAPQRGRSRIVCEFSPEIGWTSNARWSTS